MVCLSKRGNPILFPETGANIRMNATHEPFDVTTRNRGLERRSKRKEARVLDAFIYGNKWTLNVRHSLPGEGCPGEHDNDCSDSPQAHTCIFTK